MATARRIISSGVRSGSGGAIAPSSFVVLATRSRLLGRCGKLRDVRLEPLKDRAERLPVVALEHDPVSVPADAVVGQVQALGGAARVSEERDDVAGERGERRRL